MFLKCVSIFVVICIIRAIFAQSGMITYSRNKRVVPPLLIFPPTSPTRVQLIFGIGIPEGDLDFESLTNGWVLKYEYFLPSNATQLYIPARLNISGRSAPDENKNYEKYYVKAVQIDTGFDGSDPDSSLDSNGNKLDPVDLEFDKISDIRNRKSKTVSKYRWAVYKALEVAADRRKGIAGRSCVLKTICETARIPFHYQNGLFAELLHVILTPSASVDETSSYSDNEYFQAEVLGKSGALCAAVFKDCRSSFIDIFTNVLDLNSDFLKMFR